MCRIARHLYYIFQKPHHRIAVLEHLGFFPDFRQGQHVAFVQISGKASMSRLVWPKTNTPFSASNLGSDSSSRHGSASAYRNSGRRTRFLGAVLGELLLRQPHRGEFIPAPLVISPFLGESQLKFPGYDFP